MLRRLSLPYRQAAANHLGKRGRLRPRTTPFVNCEKKRLSVRVVGEVSLSSVFMKDQLGLRASKHVLLRNQDTRTNFTQTVALTHSLCYQCNVTNTTDTSVDLPRVISELLRHREKRECIQERGRTARELFYSRFKACSNFEAWFAKNQSYGEDSRCPTNGNKKIIDILKTFRHTDALRKCSSHRHRLVSDIFPTQTDIRYASSHR